MGRQPRKHVIIRRTARGRPYTWRRRALAGGGQWCPGLPACYRCACLLHRAAHGPSAHRYGVRALTAAAPAVRYCTTAACCTSTEVDPEVEGESA